MRILVTGAGGQLGLDVVEVATARGHEVVGLDRGALDITDRLAVIDAVVAHRPDVVVNAAARTDVDGCEGDHSGAFAVNAHGVRVLGDALVEHGGRLVHLSTDYVFDGTKIGPYDELDVPNPLTVYGRTKLAGEQQALRVPDALVVRTAWLCSTHGNNMVATVLGLRDRDELAFVDDQRGSPTFAHDLAGCLLGLIEEGANGLFHVTNQGEATWYEFARAVLEAAGADPDVVRPIRTDELDPPRPAPRPANSVLDNMMLRASGRPMLPDYRDSLHLVVDALT